MRHTERVLLYVVATTAIVWVIYLALQPFIWSMNAADMMARLRQGLTLSSERGLMHALLGGIMGCGMAWIAKGSKRSQFCRIAAFFVALEIAQIAVSHRHPRPVDLCIRLLTAGCGILLIHGLRYRGFRCRLSNAQISWAARVCAFGGVLVLSAWLVEAKHRASLKTWDPTFSLVVGNERTKDRPWRGCIRGFALYDRALENREVQELLRLPLGPGGVDRRTTLGATTLCSFGTVSHDPRVDLIGGLRLDPMGVDPVQSKDGYCLPEQLDLDHPVGLRADSPPSELTESLVRRAEFSVELECNSLLSYQTGPSRILSLSRDPYHRNFTVGQDGSGLIWRVRSVQNGPNGNGNEATWNDVFTTAENQRLFLTYSRGHVLLYRNGEGETPNSTALMVDPILYATRHPSWAVILFLLPIGLFVGLGWSRARTLRLAAAGGSATCLALLLAETIGWLTTGTPPDPWSGLLALVCVPAGVALAGLLGRSSSEAPSAQPPGQDTEQHQDPAPYP